MPEVKKNDVNLKSNMDRFIVIDCEFPSSSQANLKSNMDRFIGYIQCKPRMAKNI